MIPGDTAAATRGDEEGVLGSDHPDPFDPFLGFESDDHPLFERCVKSPGDHRVLGDLEADPVPEELDFPSPYPMKFSRNAGSRSAVTVS